MLWLLNPSTEKGEDWEGEKKKKKKEEEKLD